MNNLPLGTSETDPTAPWNEEVEEVYIEAIIGMTIEIPKNINKNIIELDLIFNLRDTLKKTDYNIVTLDLI